MIFEYENKRGVKYAVALYPTGLYGIMKRDTYGFTMVGVTGRAKKSWVGSREKMERILANMARRYGWNQLEPGAVMWPPGPGRRRSNDFKRFMPQYPPPGVRFWPATVRPRAPSCV